MLHKVRLGHFVIDEIGRKRPAFTEVMVEADSGDAAAALAYELHNPALSTPAGTEQPLKVGVCGIDCPTAEERQAWEAGRRPRTEVHGATGHQDEFAARRADVEAQADAETDEVRKAYDAADRMAKARAAKSAKKAAAE